MSLFNFNEAELLTFFAVMIRFSVLVAVLPFVGDRFVPMPAKVLFALAVSIALFPALLASGQVKAGDALMWGATPGGIIGTIALEAVFALVLGFTARLLFDAVHFGSNLVGNFMGFAAASTYDPHQESNSQVVAEIQMALAMLVFLAMDGHHLMLKASLESYSIVGLGKAGLGAALSGQLIQMTGQVIGFAVQIAAPIAVALFAVNIAFGVISKTLPQLNVLVLSFSVSALVGLVVMFLGMPEFQSVAGDILGRTGNWMEVAMRAMASGK